MILMKPEFNTRIFALISMIALGCTLPLIIVFNIPESRVIKCTPRSGCSEDYRGLYVDSIRFRRLCDKVYETRVFYQGFTPRELYLVEETPIQINGTYFNSTLKTTYPYEILPNDTGRILENVFNNQEIKLYEPSGCPRMFLILLVNENGEIVNQQGNTWILFKLDDLRWACFGLVQKFSSGSLSYLFINALYGDAEDWILDRVNEIYDSDVLFRSFTRDITPLQEFQISQAIDRLDLGVQSTIEISNVEILDVTITFLPQPRYRSPTSSLAIPGYSTIDQHQAYYYYTRLEQDYEEGIKVNILGDSTIDLHDSNGNPRMFIISVGLYTDSISHRYLLLKSFDGYWCFGEIRDGFPSSTSLRLSSVNARITEALQSNKLFYNGLN